MDTILKLHTQDPSGAALRDYLDEADTSLESQDQQRVFETEDWRLTEVNMAPTAYSSSELSYEHRLKMEKGRLIQVGDEETSGSIGDGTNAAQLDEVAGKLVNILIDVGHSFDVDTLVQSIYTMTEVVRNQRHPHRQLFSLFSRLLVIAANAPTVLIPDSSKEISGIEFKNIILDRICTAPWNHKSVLPLASALADVEMESKQLEMAIIKIMKQFKQVDAADLPILIHNLLLLSSKGHQQLVLRGSLEFFDRLNAGGHIAESLRSENTKGAAHLGFSELSAIESTVILHFSYAVRQDQELGTELLKHMKNGKTAYLSSFSLACLMTMARIHRFEDSVLDYLKSSILAVFKDQERLQRESWVLQFEGMSPPLIQDMFYDIIRKIPFGLEQLTPSIVQSGVYIMDYTAPPSPWKSSDAVKKQGPKTPNERACELGASILAETFKTQASARTEILDHIMSRIVTKSTNTVYFLDLLESITKDSPEALEEHLSRVKESLDYLSFLSPSIAVRLMAAVKDVAKQNRSFRGSLILILRKALFSKSLESRQVALSGFLLLLKPSSKPQMSMRGGSSRHGGAQGHETDLFGYSMEILGMLRRCLGQQGEVRLALYVGLMEIVEVVPQLNPIVFEILQAHFAHFYDPTFTRVSPLILEDCVGQSRTGGEPTFVEPLQYLMSGVIRSLVGLQKLKRKAPHTQAISADEHLVEECLRDLDHILLGLERAGLEDFELDKTSDFSMANNIGIRNNMYATLLNGCYEAAIEFVVLRQSSQGEAFASNGKRVAHSRQSSSDLKLQSMTLNDGCADLILHLFGKMRKLHDIVKEKVVMQRGKKLGPLGEASALGLECVTKLVECMFAGPAEGEEPDTEALRLKSNDDFLVYITTVVQALLTKLHTSTESLSDNDHDYCRRLTSVLVREFIVSERPDGPKAMAAGAKGKDKNKSWLMTGIEALTAGLMTVQRFYPISTSTLGTTPEDLHNRKIVAGFLAATLPQANGGHGPGQQASAVVAWTTSRTILNDVDSIAAAYIQFLQELLVLFVNETIPLLKEAVGVLQMIQVLSKYLSRSTDASNPEGQQGAAYPEPSRASSMLSTDSVSSGPSQLDQLVHWLVKLCRDQAVDDTTLTKALLSMMLQLEQECASPQANADLLAIEGAQNGSGSTSRYSMGPVSLGFGIVTASSVVSRCPEAATRLRLAADILLAYGMNHGGPHLPSLRDLPDEIPPGQEVEEDIVRLMKLKSEIGVDARFSVVTLRTSGVVTDVLLQQVERSLEGLEWALGKLRYCGLAQAGSDRPCPKQSTNGSHAQHHESRLSQAHGLCQPNDYKVAMATKPFQEFEGEICWRVEACLWVLVRISQSCINQATSEHLIRVLQKCYKVLTALTKHYLKPMVISPLNLFPALSSSSLSLSSVPSTVTGAAKGSLKSNGGQSKANSGVIQLPHGFLRVTQVAGMELSVHLYTFLSYFQMLDEEQKTRAQERQANGKKGGGKGKGDNGDKGIKDPMDDGVIPKNQRGFGGGAGAGAGGGGAKSRQKAKILRESKLIPTLIYGVEQYERFVIQLSKKSKVDLIQFMRRSTARDFRIQIQRLGDLGLEDQYDEERQLQLLQQRQQQEQEQQQQGQEQLQQHEGDVEMDVDDDEGLAQENEEEEEDEEEENLERHRKRARRLD
ncbi:hypothetical protein BGX29_008636 [Mortierella sp. GBA35]|nr:hypothetical protein BGX29_008636 [Mortierella sp. GBA35]